MTQTQVSIIVPTLNEAENLPLLVPRIDAAMAGRAYEILIVDDNSRDNTPQVCAELAARYPLALLVRQSPKDGLGGAVLHGMAMARGATFVVMDADLQHPPEKVPELLAALEGEGVDFALGSRYVPGGSTEVAWSAFRRVNSWAATVLARPFSGSVHDPMSGFFALRRPTYERAERLMPLGYKIALELMCKCRVRRVAEVPIHFGLRARGESKLSFREQFRYLEHLSRLYDFTYPRASPMAKFLIATAMAWTAGLAAAAVLLWAGVALAPAVAMAYGAGVGVTALLHLRYVLAQREFIVTGRPWRDFLIIAALEWLSCAAAATWLTWRIPDASAGEVFLLSFGLTTAVRYVLRKEFMQDLRGLRRVPREELR